MALVTKVEPIQDWIEITADRTLSPQARSTAVANYAREQIEEASAANRRVAGREVPRKQFVDGREGAQLDTVDPDGGIIVAEWDLVLEVLRAIAVMLVERSPVVKGDYVRGHRLFADDVEVANTDAGIPFAETYSFVNLVPYARKIEIGKTKSGRPFVVQVPNRIYERTAKDAQGRFGNIVKIRFSYRSPLMTYQATGSLGARHSRRGGVERETRAPAIIVSVR